MIVDLNLTHATARVMMSRPLPRGRACMNCRFLKIKCDGMKPICGPCRKHPKDDECEWSDGPARSRTKQLEETVRLLEARLYKLEHHEGSTPSATGTAACMACRLLKLTCDGINPICGPCRTRPKDHGCRYSNGPANSGTKELEDTVQSLEARMYKLEHPEDFSDHAYYDRSLDMHTNSSGSPRPSSLSGFSMVGSEESHDSPLPPRGWNLPHQPIFAELDLTGKVTKSDIYPFDSGSGADVYRGALDGSVSDHSNPPKFPAKVAVKIFRRLHSEPETVEQMCQSLNEEAQIWRHLDHPNILPFLGIALNLGLSPALISPLCASGSIMKYFQHDAKDPKTRLQMTIGVAAGLEYLHSKAIIHGNLCTKKILINGDGSPAISGYGIFKVVRQLTNTTSPFSSPIRFSAPECFSVEVGISSIRTTPRDVYAFSMVALEILSGLEPYHHLPIEHTVFMHVLRGDRPIRTHMDQRAVTNGIWRLFTSLWNQNPAVRPGMSDVVSRLIQIRDDQSTVDEDSGLIPPEAVPPRNQNEDIPSSGEETAFEDPSLLDIHGPDLKGRVTQDDHYPFAGGGNANIYRGKLTRSDGRKIRIAIKMIRISDDGSGQLEDIMRRLRREVDVWSQLKHKNVLPFFGVCEDLAPTPVLISPFYKFGHVGAYLRNHPEMGRKELVQGVASGLEFLHANNIIHGDLKVQNVLVDKCGVPCICDFGISKIVNRRGFTTSSVGTAPYMAPELFFVVDRMDQEQSPSTTKSSDVYSFALLVLEMLTAEAPKRRPSKPIVTAKIHAELRPKRADYDVRTVKIDTWFVLDRCWNFEPHMRPSISYVRRELDSSFRADAATYRQANGVRPNMASRVLA